MRIGLYPGTFDPLTFGHLDVAERAAKLFDEVVIAVAANAEKGPLFSPAERLALIQPNLAAIPNARALTFTGLLVDCARSVGATALIRGIRAVSDFEFEFQMALMNRHLDPRLETVFLMPKEELIYTSSHLVKQVARYGGDVAHFVPPNVRDALHARFHATPRA